MTFAIRWSKQAERLLDRLPGQIAHRIITKVNAIRDNPFHFLEHYEGAAIFKLRIGSYRVLMDVDLKTATISVRTLGHRRNIYKGIL